MLLLLYAGRNVGVVAQRLCAFVRLFALQAEQHSNWLFKVSAKLRQVVLRQVEPHLRLRLSVVLWGCDIDCEENHKEALSARDIFIQIFKILLYFLAFVENPPVIADEKIIAEDANTGSLEEK